MKPDIRLLFLCMSPFAMPGCSVFPTSGPYSWWMADEAGYEASYAVVVPEGHPPMEKVLMRKPSRKLDYALLDLTPDIVDYFSGQAVYDPNTIDWPNYTKPIDVKVSVGDSLSVTIYESKTGGLFLPSEAGVRAGNFVSLPEQTIDKTGMITIPFAGQIQAAGKTQHQISEAIVKQLETRAIEPQAVVAIRSQSGSQVSVVGEVGSPTRYSLNLGGERVIDAIARAGGPSFPGHQIFVTLQRDQKEWTIPFDLLLNDPKKNIYLQPNDTLYLLREPPHYQMFGASGTSGSFDFPKRRITLAEAIGEARGLDDDRADPSEIYLYRTETKQALQEAGVQLEALDSKIVPDELPVIYKLNLRKAEGFFLAQSFPIRNKDIIYVANAESVEFTKLLNLIGVNSSTKINTQTSIEQ